MPPVFRTHFLSDCEKGWDRENWAVEENERKRFGARETQVGVWATSAAGGTLTCPDHEALPLVRLVIHWGHRAQQSPGER